MNVAYAKSFLKDTHQISDKSVSGNLMRVINLCKSATSLKEITNLKKMSGHKTAYRIRVGDYRIGFYFENNEILFVRVMHRKEIYRYFP